MCPLYSHGRVRILIVAKAIKVKTKSPIVIPMTPGFSHQWWVCAGIFPMVLVGREGCAPELEAS